MDRPNVLLICVEHWSGRLMSALGHPAVMTPTLDSLAANGVLFTNAYSTTPVCIPARRELMTGTFSRTHGARSFDQKITMDGRPTLPQTFRDAGYQAYAVGKLHVQPQRARIGFDDVMLDEAAKERRHNPDDYEMFLTAEGYHGQQLTHAIGQRLLHEDVAPPGACAPGQLDGPRDVPVHSAARPEPASLLVHVIRAAAPTADAPRSVHGPLPQRGRGRALRRRLGRGR